MSRILNAAAMTASVALVVSMFTASPALAATGDEPATGGAITGTVRGVLGEAFGDGCVTVSSDVDGDGVWSAVGLQVETAPDGSYVVEGLAAGTYAVSAEACDGDPSYETTWYHSGAVPPTTAEEGLISIVESGSASAVDLQMIPAAIQNLTVPTVSDLPSVGVESTADPGTWSVDGLAFEVKWFADGAEIAGATGAKFVPTAAQLGAELSVTVRAERPGFDPATAASASTGPVLPGTQTEFSAVISGVAKVGETLTTTLPNGEGVTVQWNRDGAPVPGAVSTSFVLSADDLGAAMTVTVSQVLEGYEPLVVTSAPTAPVELGSQSSFTPLVTGTVAVGKTLSVSVPAGPSYSYQWIRNGAAISGATSNSYTAVAADLGLQLKVRVIASVSGFADRTAESASTVKVAAGTIAAFTPAVKGVAVVGSTLSVSVPTGNSYAYQWLRNGAKIAAATGSTYKLVSADAGTGISVTVTASRPGYGSLTKTAPPTATVLRALTASPTPTISGTRKVGQTLTAVPGSWSPAPVTLRYQWYRSGAAITGATSSSYRTAAADLGKSISVVVNGSKSGYASVVRKSGGTAGIAAGTISVPTPTVSGTVRVGYTLAASAAVSPSGSTLAYQWYRSGTAITGATAATYRLTTSDYGKTISVRITASRLAYTTTAKASVATSAVGPGAMTGPTPSVTGTARLGYTLKAAAGTWPSGTTLKYQWRANGVAISGATGSSYFLNSGSLGGKRITVSVTGSRYAFSPLTRTSSATAAVVVPGSTIPVVDWTCPSWAPIKGNQSSMIYHMPGQRYYNATNPEMCFSTERAAVSAGYRKAKV
ncbi:hypothetical protein [Agromyces sp. NPDC058126]|uniref:sunset domain-containing protein n=1 Tax=Agromyces sp. NPDC058126 TaxID=3346350 RepID=UPI0036D96B62